MTPIRDRNYTWQTNDSNRGQQLHMTNQWLQSGTATNMANQWLQLGKATTHGKPMTPIRDSNYTWQTNDSNQGQQLHMTTNDSSQGQQLHMTNQWLQLGTATTHDKPMTPVKDSKYTWPTNDSSQGQQIHMTNQW